MKNTIVYLLAFSFLLQSCHVYETINVKETKLVVGKNYQIKQDTEFINAKLEKINDSTLTVLEGKTQKDITISKIKEIKEKKVSASKTVWLCAGITFSVVLVLTALVTALEPLSY